MIRVSFQLTENKMFKVIVLSFSSNSATSMTFTTDLKVRGFPSFSEPVLPRSHNRFVWCYEIPEKILTVLFIIRYIFDARILKVYVCIKN